MIPVTTQKGSSPIVLGLPHTGTFVPGDVATKLNENGRKLANNDWHIDRLYADLMPQIHSKANFHCYLIDIYQDPSGVSLYPAKNTSTLVLLTDFDNLSIWHNNPTDTEVMHRRTFFHAFYHEALNEEWLRVCDLYGIDILYDCYCLCSSIPFLFDGILPDFIIGTNWGATCDLQIEAETRTICNCAKQYSSITNARFKGGWTKCHYGQPVKGFHGTHFELAQLTYLMDEAAPWTFDYTKAAGLRPQLASILTTLADLGPTLRGSQ
jgi:formiminoglutamase